MVADMTEGTETDDPLSWVDVYVEIPVSLMVEIDGPD